MQQCSSASAGKYATGTKAKGGKVCDKHGKTWTGATCGKAFDCYQAWDNMQPVSRAENMWLVPRAGKLELELHVGKSDTNKDMGRVNVCRPSRTIGFTPNWLKWHVWLPLIGLSCTRFSWPVAKLPQKTQPLLITNQNYSTFNHKNKLLPTILPGWPWRPGDPLMPRSPWKQTNK